MKPYVLALAVLAAAEPAHAEQVPLSADAAFTRAARALLDLGALPTTRDRELLFIKTDPVQLRDTAAEADCGKMFGIPYTKDKRVKVAASYQVTIRPIGEASSDVSVSVTLDGYMDVNEGAPFFVEKTRDKSKALTCRSTGALEAQLIQKLRSQ